MFPSRGPHIGDYAQTTLADPPKSRIDALGDPYHFFSVGASREACLLGALKRLVCFGFFGAPKCVAICPCATFLDFQLLCFALICFDLLRFASIWFDLLRFGCHAPEIFDWEWPCLHGKEDRSGERVPERAERFKKALDAPGIVDAATDSLNAPERGGGGGGAA